MRFDIKFKARNSYSFVSYFVLCCGGHFSSITVIVAKTKYRSPYLLNVWQPYLQNHIKTPLERPWDVSEGRPQNVGRTCPLELQIRPYSDVLVMPTRDVLKRLQGMSLGITYRTLWQRLQNVTLGLPLDVTLGCPQDVIFQCPKDVGRGRPQDVGRGRPQQ